MRDTPFDILSVEPNGDLIVQLPDGEIVRLVKVAQSHVSPMGDGKHFSVLDENVITGEMSVSVETREGLRKKRDDGRATNDLNDTRSDR